MKYCSKCGKEIVDDAVICLNCGCMVADHTKNPTFQQEDTADVGLCVLSALIPLFGIIYWPVKHKESPKKAKACGVTSLISWALCTLILLLVS